MSSRGRGRGRGRGGDRPSPGGGRGGPRAPTPAPPQPSSHVHARSAPTPTHSVAASSSSSASASQLAADVETKLTVTQTLPPASSKASRLPTRPGYGTYGTKVVVKANHFLVQVADRDLYHYDVSITPEVTSKKVCRDVIKRLSNLYGEKNLGRRKLAYDGQKSLYTAGALPFDSKEFVVTLGDGASRPGPSSLRKERQFKVTVKFASKPNLYHLHQFLNSRQLDAPQEVIHALDVVLRTKPSEDCIVIGRSFFHSKFGMKGELGDGVEFWRGYYQSLRPTQMGLSLNIDVSARPFYESVLVTEFIQKHFNLRDLSRPLNKQNSLKVKKALKGLRVQASHTGYPISYKITGISDLPTSEIMFSREGQSKKISVVQYFRENYSIALKFPFLPALRAGSDKKPVYVPMELCKIVEGQRFSRKLNEKQITNLLRACCQRPSDRQANVQEILRTNNFNGSDLVTSDFGMQVGFEPAVVNARVLPPPMLKYHDTGKDKDARPATGQWNMINKKVVDGGRVKHWGFINFSQRIPRHVPEQFCDELVKMCNSKGMAFNPKPLVYIPYASSNQIEKALKDLHEQVTDLLGSTRQGQDQCQLLIIILPDFKGSYGTIKTICETELGIVSQCCQPHQARKMQKQYLENVTLKINVKVGGRNTVLDDAIRRRLPLVTDQPTIIFGADVTHPQAGEDSSPSIAAVVASMDWPEITKYRCLVSAQSSREEIIKDLYTVNVDPKGSEKPGGMIRELLIAFLKSTGRKPQRIIFYRDGVSEGQFNEVLLYEMDAIRKACASLENGYLPPVTFVVVQKRHHTRLFPDYGKRDQMDRSGNILPGTVVDTSICHPTEFDFYLNSHAGIQGTSRPAHYHVLFDENKFSADAIQILTNCLCYTYARCTRSVSIVPPAYYAHLGAFRARYYIEREISDISASGESRRTVSTLPKIKDNVKDVMFYC